MIIVSPVFIDLSYYASVNPDLAAAGLTTEEQLLEHLQTFGVLEGREFSPLVDLEYYRNSYSDLASLSNEQLLEHLQTFGLAETREFSPLVNLEFYRNSYSDLASLSNEQLFEHLQTFGIQEGRRFSPVVDLTLYLNSYPDLAAAFGNDREELLRHLANLGVSEGRTIARGLNLSDYLADNPDVAVAVGGSLEGALEHLLNNGVDEGRVSQSFAAESYQIQAAQQFVEAYEQAFINPNNFVLLDDLMTEDVVWTFPAQRQLIGPNPLQLVGNTQIAGFFAQALTTYYPNSFEALEFLPSSNPQENQVAARVTQSGVGTQTGRDFVGDTVFLLSVNTEGQIQAFDFFSNSYPVAAAALDSEVPIIPADDPLTTQPALIDQSADPQAARQVAEAMWQSVIALQSGDFNALPTFQALNAPDVVWSFAVGGPDVLPYVGAAQGLNPEANSGVLPELLGPLGQVVAPGNLSIVETFADGNRVLVRLREENAIARETGTQYDLDILSWITVENGQVQSNQVIVDSYQTVDALRPGDTSILAEGRGSTRHVPPYFVTGSRINQSIVTFDQAGDFQGVLYQANNFDAPELYQPIGITYGPDGDLYATSTLSADGTIIANTVLKFGGVYGNYLDDPATPRAADDPNTPDNEAFYVGNEAVFGDVTNVGSLINTDGTPYIGVGAPTTGLLIPSGIKFGPDGNFYVASAFTSRILQYNGETGDFLGTFATRNNGATNLNQFGGAPNTPPGDNVLNPGGGPPDFSVFVFGPDGGIYAGSIRTDIDPITGRPEINPATGTEDPTFVDDTDGLGAVLRFPGPTWAVDPATGGRIDPITGAVVSPGAPAGIGNLASFGIFGEAGGSATLDEPSAVAFGPDLNLYVASAQTGQILRYAGPSAPNAGAFLGVFANVEAPVDAETGIDLPLILSGMGFGPDGNIYVGSSYEVTTGAPVGGSQISIFAGPNSATPGAYLGPYGDVTTGVSRLLLPTTPEFTFFENSYTTPTPTRRFPEIAYVVGVNTDRPFDATTGTPGFFLSDETDTLAAYNQAGSFLGFLGTDLTNGSLGTDLPAGVDNPQDGIGGAILGPSGNILVSSQLSDQVLEYSSLTGEFIGVFGDASNAGSGLDFPAGLAASLNNSTVYVSDLLNERILRFDAYTGEFLDDPNTAENEGVLVDLDDTGENGRFTDMDFGQDGRLYVGLAPALEAPVLGESQVRVYNPDTGVLEYSITGLDFAAALTFGPDANLYVSDDPASVVDPLTGEFLDPTKESRVVVYDIDEVHPLLTVVDPATGQPVADPNGQRQPASLVHEFNVGFGNGGAISAAQDGTLYLSNPVSGTVSRYSPTGQLIDFLNLSLPGAALGTDADGLARPTGSAFISEGFA